MIVTGSKLKLRGNADDVILLCPAAWGRGQINVIDGTQVETLESCYRSHFEKVDASREWIREDERSRGNSGLRDVDWERKFRTRDQVLV
jgi:hypothetical protein